VLTPPIEILFGQRVPRCTHHVDKVYDGYYTLQLADAGRVRLKVGRDDHSLKAPLIWSCYPGPRITFHPADGTAHWSHRFIAFRGPGVAQWVSDGIFPIQPQHPRGATRAARACAMNTLLDEFDQMLAASRRADRLGQRIAVHLLEGLLLRIADNHRRTTDQPTWLAKAVELLGSEDGGQDVASVADQLDMPPSTLRRKFRQLSGMSPRQYLVASRVATAKALLLDTELPIKTIAARAGYRDVFFFSRQFRQQTGQPPAAYRKNREG
jgi:AraC-like DNA-binding protein